VLAGDIDPEAVRVAAENARHNGIGPLVALYAAPGVRDARADRSRHFDLVMANILARPLMRLAPALARVLSSGGTLILSGLLIRDVPGVASAYRSVGLSLVSKAYREGWATLVLKRGGVGARVRRA